jgi:hypothetical protein
VHQTTTEQMVNDLLLIQAGRVKSNRSRYASVQVDHKRIKKRQRYYADCVGSQNDPEDRVENESYQYLPLELCGVASISSQMRSRSALERLEPLGRQRPSANTDAAKSPPRIRLPAKTGWRWSGFQTGRDSILCACKARRTSSREAPKRAGSIVMHVSQKFPSPCDTSGMNSIPCTAPSAAR